MIIIYRFAELKMSAEEKKKKRLESRKRKMEAYIAVAELNDTEKNKKRKKEG